MGNILKGILPLLLGLGMCLLANWQTGQIETQEEAAALKYIKVDRNISNYRAEYVRTGTLTAREKGAPAGSGGGVGTLHANIGFFRTKEGLTYTCEQPNKVKQYEDVETYEDGAVSFWIKKHDNTNTIYQLQAADGQMILTYSDTIRGFPSMKGVYVFYTFGILLSLIGVGVLIFGFFQKKK